MQEVLRLIRTIVRYADSGQLHELQFTKTVDGPCSIYFSSEDITRARSVLGSRSEAVIDPARPEPDTLPPWVTHNTIGTDPGGGVSRGGCWHDCFCNWWCFSHEVRLIWVGYQYAFGDQLHELGFTASTDGPCSLYFNGDEATKVRNEISPKSPTTPINPAEPDNLPAYVEHSVLGAAPGGGVGYDDCIWHDCFCNWWCFGIAMQAS